MRQKVVIFIALSLACVVGFSGTIDPNTPDSKHIEYGSKFVYIAKVHGTTPDTKPYFGSGIAHQSNVIITAAHIVQDVGTCRATINSKTINVSKIIVHPNYKMDQFGYYDIAICILEDDIGLEWYPELYTNKNEVGKICSIAGYGATGNFLVGVNKLDDKLRAGSNTIDSIDRGLLVCSPSRTNRTELEYCIASGDSGGGLFIGNKLAGINSCVIHDKGMIKSAYGTFSGHTRISDHVEWITNTISTIKESK